MVDPALIVELRRLEAWALEASHPWEYDKRRAVYLRRLTEAAPALLDALDRREADEREVCLRVAEAAYTHGIARTLRRNVGKAPADPGLAAIVDRVRKERR